MALIGLSTLYLNLSGVSYRELLDELRRERDGVRMEVWELVDNGDYSLNKERVKLLQTLVDEGYRFTVHCPYDITANLCHPNSGIRRNAIEKVKTSIDYASDLEALAYVLHPGRRVKEGMDERLAKGLHQQSMVALLDYGDAAGIKVAVENMPPGYQYFMVHPAEFEELSETTGLDVKVAFDAGHAHIGGLVRSFLKKLSHKFAVVHVHDTRGGRDEHLNIGEGVIEWKYIVSELVGRGFSGIYIVEAIREPFKSIEALKRLLTILY